MNSYILLVLIFLTAMVTVNSCTSIEPLSELMHKVCVAMHKPDMMFPRVEFVDGETLQVRPNETVLGYYIPSQGVACLNRDNWNRDILVHELAHHAGADEIEAREVARILGRWFEW